VLRNSKVSFYLAKLYAKYLIYRASDNIISRDYLQTTEGLYFRCVIVVCPPSGWGVSEFRDGCISWSLDLGLNSALVRDSSLDQVLNKSCPSLGA